MRNVFYDAGILPVRKLSVPVISVGNISVGGTGKTSFVRYICEILGKEYNIAILSRGYRRKSKGTVLVASKGEILCTWKEAGDEPYFLAKILRKKGIKVNVIVEANRYKAGILAVKKLNAEIIVLDDGFQHRKLKRDLDLVLIKKRDLKDKLLPFGRLREPLNSLKRADAILLSYQELDPFDFFFKNKPVFKIFRKNWKLLSSQDLNEINIKDIQKSKVIAFCGLGDSTQFFKILQNLGIKIKEEIAFPDHYHYENFSLKRNEIYITTLKDGVKIPPQQNLFFLDFEIEVEGFKEFLLTKVKEIKKFQQK